MSNEQAPHPVIRCCLYVLLLAPILALQLLFDRSASFWIIGLYMFAFLPYYVIYKRWHSPQLLREALFTGILIRLLLMPTTPTLSDDYFRFVWDGQLQVNNMNPYAYPPSEIASITDSTLQMKGLDSSLYANLNSKDYFSIYPPAAQAFFYLTAVWADNNFQLQILLLKILFFIPDFLVILLLPGLLQRFGKKPNWSLLYILNPLIIIELTGNIHMESGIISFSFLALYFFSRQRMLLSAILLGIALSFKFNILLLMPLLLLPLTLKKAIPFITITLLTFLSSFLFYLNAETASHIFKSIGLYFHTFEFNGGVFNLYRLGGPLQYVIRDIFRLLLPALTLLLLLMLTFRMNIRNIALGAVWVFGCYLLLSPTVHPWYISPLILLSIFTSVRFPLIWSFLLPLSYTAYATNNYTESMWLITLEYTVVWLVVVAEWKQAKLHLFPDQIFERPQL